MARTVKEIQLEILSAKNADGNLNSLNSSSQTEPWRLWVYIIAVAIHLHERLFDAFKSEIEETLDLRQPGTPGWYAEKCLEFQLGDDLIIDNGKITYAVFDEEKQIVKRVGYKDDSGTLTLKTAKESDGVPEALSAIELNQLKAYIEKVKFVGTDVQATSLNADKMRLTATIYYDGIYAQADIQTAVEAALNNYMTNLPFNGIVIKNKVIDAIQAVEGVHDIVITTLTIVTGITPTVVARTHELPSGYLIEDDEAGQTFADLLTYTAE
ncbi:MAG: baseplate J/gp47 family protein [Cytophagales bacterium]|nr:baseplate J/gp47 family protein [Cytophagales bacterium]